MAHFLCGTDMNRLDPVAIIEMLQLHSKIFRKYSKRMETLHWSRHLLAHSRALSLWEMSSKSWVPSWRPITKSSKIWSTRQYFNRLSNNYLSFLAIMTIVKWIDNKMDNYICIYIYAYRHYNIVQSFWFPLSSASYSLHGSPFRLMLWPHRGHPGAHQETPGRKKIGSIWNPLFKRQSQDPRCRKQKPHSSFKHCHNVLPWSYGIMMASWWHHDHMIIDARLLVQVKDKAMDSHPRVFIGVVLGQLVLGIVRKKWSSRGCRGVPCCGRMWDDTMHQKHPKTSKISINERIIAYKSI